MNTALHSGGYICSRVIRLQSLAVVAAAIPMALAASVANGQEGSSPLEEVIVTAQKRSENLQDVALSISALTGADLETKGAEGFRDWAQYVPGVTMYQGASANRRAGPTAVIRGVSQTGGGQIQEVSSMATSTYMIGQVPIFSGDPGLFDLNRIEVLRGPQGTLFGLASMGGTIRFIPNEAQVNDFAAEVGIGGSMIKDGSTGYDFNAMVNLPLIRDKLAVRLAGIQRNSGGYIDVFKIPLTQNDPNQIFVDGRRFDPRPRDGDSVIEDANSAETTGMRLSAKFTPTDRFTVNAFVMWQRSDQRMKQAIDYNDQSKEWVASRFALEPQKDEFTITSLEASYDLGFGSLEYVGGYFDSSLSETIDSTTLTTTFLNGSGEHSSVHALDMDGPGGLPRDPWPAPVQFPFETGTKIVTNELRVQGADKSLGVSLFGSGLTFDYVVGLFKMSEDRSGGYRIASPEWNANRGPNTVPILTENGLIGLAGGSGSYDNQAAFADVTLHLTPRFSIGGGLRYSENDRDSVGYSWSFGRAANGATEGADLTAPPDRETRSGLRQYSVTPRYTAKYQFDDQRMIFATVAKGERMPSSFANPEFWSGALPGSARANPVCRNLAHDLGVFDDAENGTTTDEVWSYDFGLKSTWLDRRLQLNTSVYYLDWENLQRNVQMSQFSAECNILIPANVGAVEIKGLEFEMVYVPVDSVTINTAIGYTDAQVAETVPGVNDSLGQPLEKGDAIENVAPWTASVGLEYRFGVNVINELMGTAATGFARVDWRYVDERMGTNVGDEASLKADPIRSQFVSSAYDLTDLRFGLSDDSWSAAVYVSNVFNDRAMYESFRETWLPNQRIVSVSRPRTIGLALKRMF